MEFHWSFVETPRDRLDAYDAVLTAGTGARNWARAVLGLFGLLLLVGIPVAFLSGAPVWSHWLALGWLVVGLTLSWRFVLQPVVVRSRLRRTFPTSVRVEISDEGVLAQVDGSAVTQWFWGEFTSAVSTGRGVGLGFRDGTTCWLPIRVLGEQEVRSTFEAFLASKLPGLEAA
jgi:hypothetical protein